MQFPRGYDEGTYKLICTTGRRREVSPMARTINIALVGDSAPRKEGLSTIYANSFLTVHYSGHSNTPDTS